MLEAVLTGRGNIRDRCVIWVPHPYECSVIECKYLNVLELMVIDQNSGNIAVMNCVLILTNL